MSKFGFGAKANAWPAIKKAALEKIADVSVKDFDENFDNQGVGGKKWKEVKRRIPSTQAYRQAGPDGRVRPILQGETGNLRRATQIESVTSNEAAIVNDTDYAALQNRGGINGGGGNVPARPFIKQTKELTKKQLTVLKDVTDEIWSVK